jgi:hypothetical protein
MTWRAISGRPYSVEIAIAGGGTVVLGLVDSMCACAPCPPLLQLRSSALGGRVLGAHCYIYVRLIFQVLTIKTLQ